MFLLRRNMHDVSYADHLVICFRSNDTLACSDKQHLITAVESMVKELDQSGYIDVLYK
jgi:hypothetical protein